MARAGEEARDARITTASDAFAECHPERAWRSRYWNCPHNHSGRTDVSEQVGSVGPAVAGPAVRQHVRKVVRGDGLQSRVSLRWGQSMLCSYVLERRIPVLGGSRWVLIHGGPKWALAVCTARPRR